MTSLESTKQCLSNSVWRIFIVFGIALLLSGCNTLGLKAPWDNSENPDYTLITENLVNTASQLPNLTPLLSTVQVGKPRTKFDKSVIRELAEKGYKIEKPGEGDGVKLVNSQVRQVSGDNGSTHNLYVLSIGKVSVERAFDTLAGKTVPVSEQIIRGADKRSVTLNDDIFPVPSGRHSNVAFKAYDGPDIEDVLKPEKPQRGIAFWRSPKKNAVKSNVYETMASNYKDVFNGYEDIDQSILIFPNDSLRLGDVNKSIIEQFVENMDPETDILSVIGCSHGDTDISNGNSLLALGRANRVKEAFLFSGISHDQVLEEGCWAPQTFDEVMPQRGVVLTLKRRADS